MRTPLQDNHSANKPRFLILHDFPTPEIEALWREFLSRLEFPTHYDTPEFFREPYWTSSNPFAVLAFVDSKVVGVLTGLHEGKRAISGLPSRPQVCLDPRADPVVVTDTLAEGLLSAAKGAQLISVFSWQTTPLPAFQRLGFQVQAVDEVAVLDLTPGAKTIFDDLAKNRRRDVRLALRNGIEVAEETTDADLREYWNVYSTWRKTPRKTIQHNRSFAAVEKVHNLRGNHRRFLARYQGKVIAAAGFRFCPGGVIEYANNCSLDEYMNLLPNDLLVWRTIEWACQQGFKRYSFGGAHPFLRKWSATVIPIMRYRLDRTLFHRHDLRDTMARTARKVIGRMPPGLQDGIKKVLGKG